MLEDIGQVIICACLGGGTANGLLPIIGLQLKENAVPATFILFHPPAQDVTAAGRARAAILELRRFQTNLVIIEAMDPEAITTAADLVGALSLRLRQPAALRPDGEAIDTMLHNAARARIRITGGAGIDGLAAMVDGLALEPLPTYETLLAIAIGGAGIPAGTLMTARDLLISQGWPSSQILFETAIAEAWNDDLLLVEMICRPFVHESRDAAPVAKGAPVVSAPPEQPELFGFVEPAAVPEPVAPAAAGIQESAQLELPLLDDEPDPVPVAVATPEEEDAAPEPWEDDDVEAGEPEPEDEPFVPEEEPMLELESAPVEAPEEPVVVPAIALPAEPAASVPAPEPTEPSLASTPVAVPEPVTPPEPAVASPPLITPELVPVPSVLPPLPTPATPVVPTPSASAESPAAATTAQGEFTLRELKRGVFEKAPPTTWNGENLDVPTYLRRGLHLLGDQPASPEEK
jgi:hypothetical protein